ncbi:hypothetical protein LZ575_16355 [Antarcticibacterium sp. 1MA-6-2]|uniref:hypothetical protein n=1 Tax=Antarcticibacterium sp. 1MA-6-2 TaxID=2908210 RepID=UPI001F3826BE|nr:hypothetical protein [Antarcticibacterium sp. 1MA-6-2]UJH90394.1 hypothetical protein LZ575_16355 [Antarcticibacterium sp. 1MA-6-2]
MSAGNKITDWVGYTANFGLLWPGNGEGPIELYVFNLGFSLTDRIGTFVEVYGRLEDFTANYDT